MKKWKQKNENILTIWSVKETRHFRKKKKLKSATFVPHSGWANVITTLIRTHDGLKSQIGFWLLLPPRTGGAMKWSAWAVYIAQFGRKTCCRLYSYIQPSGPAFIFRFVWFGVADALLITLFFCFGTFRLRWSLKSVGWPFAVFPVKSSQSSLVITASSILQAHLRTGGFRSPSER